MKNNHSSKSFLCKPLTEFLATGLVCAADLLSCPIPAAPCSGNNPFCENNGSEKSGLIFESYSGGSTDNGQGIAPQHNDESLIDIEE